jgi:hypothetical protein
MSEVMLLVIGICLVTRWRASVKLIIVSVSLVHLRDFDLNARSRRSSRSRHGIVSHLRL